MYISNIEIKNFRSIEHINISVDHFNVFVGQNNHGKSNFLEAIEWFYNGSGDVEEIKRKGTKPKDISVEVEFSQIQDGFENMKNEKNRTSIQNKIGEQTQQVKIVCKISDKGSVERLFLNPNTLEYETTGIGANNFLNDFLPKLQFVKTETSLKDIKKYGKTTEIGQMLSGVINEILVSEDPEYKAFIEKFHDLFVSDTSKVSSELKKIGHMVEGHLKKQFAECEEVQFEVKSPKFEDLLKNFEVNIDDGHRTTAEEKGDGMQRALMLAIIQAYADYRRENENIKNFIFLIDEAELHLHPTAQRSLKNALVELAKQGDQVILTSHSSVLIADEIEDQKLFKVEKNNSISDIKEISQIEKPSVVYDLLGGSPADLLLPRNFLLVEGPTDKVFIDLIIQRFYSDKKQIQIIPVWGDTEKTAKIYDYLGSIFAPLNKSLYQKKVVILLDKIPEDKSTNFTDFLNKFPDLKSNKLNQIFELNVGSLEEYYPVAKDDQIKDRGPALWRREKNHGMNSHQKNSLAKCVGENIDQAQFESEMLIIFDCLKKVWENSYD